jgi:hypothetical protein
VDNHNLGGKTGNAPLIRPASQGSQPIGALMEISRGA